MDKKILVLTTILIAATFGTVLFAGYLNVPRSSEANMGPVEESLHFESCLATKSGGDLNVSMTVACVIDGGKTVTVNEFKLNMVSQRNIADLSIYVNGTLFDTAKMPVWVLENGDCLQVNLILPSSNSIVSLDKLNNGDQMRVDIVTPNVVYYQDATFQH